MKPAFTHGPLSACFRRGGVGTNARRGRRYADARSAAWGESPLMGFEAPTAALAGKKLTLAWVATSAADEAAIAALIPTPAPNPPNLSSATPCKPYADAASHAAQV